MSKSIQATLLVLFLLNAGCAGSYYRQGLDASARGDSAAALGLFYQAVAERPADDKAWFEIGMAWYRADSLSKAEEAFAASNRIRPNAISNLYLGLIFERTDDIEKAIRVYSAAGRLQGDGRTRTMIQNRLNVLIDRKLIADARSAVRGEDTLSIHSIPTNTIAVINFNGSYLPADLQPIALGLAELIAADLSKVSKLEVLERVKINVILDELKLGESRYADSRVAPRMGKLLGSRRLVLGTVTTVGESDLRIDGRLVNAIDGASSGTLSDQGDLDRFFGVEKQFVFGIIDTLGIEISKAERDAIEEVPTESFLAFMAYSKGLAYERMGLYDDALMSFKAAREEDPGFTEASALADKMMHISAYNEELAGDPSSRAKSFEQEVAPAMRAEGTETGLSLIQAANLLGGGFMSSDDLYWRFGSLPIAPPGGGPVWKGTGIVIIKGHPDAN